MSDTNAKLTKIANLIQEQSVLGNQINKLVDELSEDASYDKVIYSLPQGITFVAMRDNKTKNWVTTDNCRWIFKREFVTSHHQNVVIPVGLINLDTKTVVLFSLGDKKDSVPSKPIVVTSFCPGFYIRKDTKTNTYPQFSVGVRHYVADSFDVESNLPLIYEQVTPSNPDQINELGQECNMDGKVKSVIGYIPYRTDEVANPPFEFYQAY